MTEHARSCLAAFDFDGTLTQRDTLAGFLVHASGLPKMAKILVRQSRQLLQGARDDLLRDAAKTSVIAAALRGLTVEQLESAGTSYATQLHRQLRTETINHLHWHQAQGHTTIIVSASLVYYLRPLATSLGFDDVIGVEMAHDSSRVVTGELTHPNVRAEQKRLRLQAWIGEHFQDQPELWAYGNSSGDDQLLEMADHRVWIGKRAERNEGSNAGAAPWSTDAN